MRNTAFKEYLGPRLERSVQVRRMKNVIDRELTQRQRRIVMGFYYEQKTVTQLARELGVNKSTVSRTLSRAHQRMSRCLRY